MEKSENYLRGSISIFFANKKLIFLTALVVSILAVITGFFYPPIYLVNGSIIVKSKKINSPPEIVTDRITSRVILPPTSEDVLSETKIISSEDLIHNSLEKILGQGEPLFEEPSALKVFFKYITELVDRFLILIGASDAGDKPSEIDLLTEKISEDLSIEIVPGSNVIEVTLLYENPNIGTKILNSIFDNYLQYRLNLFTNKEAGSFFSDKLDKYHSQLDQLEKDKIMLLKQVSQSDVDKETLSQNELIESIRKDIVKLEDEYLEKQRTFTYLNQLLEQHLQKKNNVNLPFPYNFEDKEIGQFNEKLNNLLFEYSDSIKVYKENSPKIKRLIKQINDLESKLTYLIKNKVNKLAYEVETIKRTIDLKNDKLSSLKRKNQDLIKVQSDLDRINTEIKLHNANYESFFRKLEESKIEKASQISQMDNVQILNRASVPKEPYFPNKKLVIPIGILTGLLLGFSFGFIKEFFDHTFKTPDHVQRYLYMPVIGSILYNEGWRTQHDHQIQYPTNLRKKKNFKIVPSKIPTDSTNVAIKKSINEK